MGVYELTAESKGFKKFVAKNIVVTNRGHVNLVTVNLQLGGSKRNCHGRSQRCSRRKPSSTQLGAVMTDAPRSGELSSMNNAQRLWTAPNCSPECNRNWVTTSSSAATTAGGSCFRGTGGRGRSNNYMVNGGDGNDIFVNAPAIQPSSDAIEEFRGATTNTFDAEYGRNSGSGSQRRYKVPNKTLFTEDF